MRILSISPSEYSFYFSILKSIKKGNYKNDIDIKNMTNISFLFHFQIY